MTKTDVLRSAQWLGEMIQRSLPATRETLRASVADRVLDTRNVHVEASGLPLFRSVDGRLTQTVRLHVSAADALGPVRFTLRDRHGLIVDEAQEVVAGEALSVDLQVPEVREESTFALEVAGAGETWSGQVTVSPQRKWTVFLIHHSHLDVGYTDPQGMVARHHDTYFDALIDLADATEDWPDDARFRWNVEASWPLVHWLGRRSTYAVERLLSRVREGLVEVTALPFNLHTEACSTDELYQLLRTTEMLRSRYDLPVTTAMQTDVPGSTVGLVDALADADIGYLSAAHNWAGRSVPFRVGGQELERPFYWAAPSGNRVLTWFTDSAHGLSYMEGNIIGLADDYETALAVLPAYLQALASQPYPLAHIVPGWSKLIDGVPLSKHPYDHDVLHLRVQGAFADNASPSIVPAAIARQWNDTFAYPRLRMATNREFFADAEQRLSGRIPTYTGDWTDWWADGIGSGARALGYSRRAQAVVTTAETLHAAADLRSGAQGDVTGPTDRVHEKLALFDEHTWGAGNPWDDGEEHRHSGGLQWARKSEYAHQAYDDAQDLLAAGARRLGDTFAPTAGALATVVVVNAASRVRADVARIFLPSSRVPLDVRIRLVDARNGARVPHREERQENPRRPIGRYLEFVTRDVPGVGFARIDVVAGDGPEQAVDLDDATVIENDRYRLTYALHDACVSSIFDKVADRELVDEAAAAGFNQYLYDRYTTAAHVNHLSSRTTADPSLLGGRSVGHHATVLRATRDAVGETLVVDLQGEGTEWIRTTIRLPRGVDRIDITNRLHKQAVAGKESGFFCFPFGVPAGPVAYEVSGGVGAADRPVVPGAARHMRAVRHWVALEHDDLAVAWATLEAPLVQFGNVHLPYAPFPPTLQLDRAEPATIYSWALNNIWDTNFPPQQQGEMTFRYAVASATGTPSRQLATATADGLVGPLVAVLATGLDGGPPDGVFCTVDHPGVRVAAVGRSRSGHDFA
ncbi:MAG TPA: alpha-mannosidase, partial [Actinopolymorphaceae bacterium]|nr:alpha-mannosidase [Actinopolymorphaceae bacterium]